MDILLFVSFVFILAIAYYWIIRCVPDVGSYVKLRLSSVKALRYPDVVLEDTLQIFQSRMEEATNKTTNLGLNRTDTNSIACESLVQSNERTFYSMSSITKARKNAETMIENNSDSRKISTITISGDCVTESSKCLYKKLEGLEQIMSTQFGKIIENKKEIEKRLEIQEIAFQEIEKRFESFEKKTRSKSLLRMGKKHTDMTNKSPLTIQIDKMAESLENLYKKLEVMDQTNATQFINIIDNNKETDKCLKHIKEQEKTMKLELQGVRRRLESFEKKKYLGYYN